MHTAEVRWHSSVQVQDSKCEFVLYSSYSLKSKHWFTNGDVYSYYYYYCNILCRLTLTLALNIKKHYPLISFKRKMNRHKQNKWQEESNLICLSFQLAMMLCQFTAHRLFSLLPAVTFWCILWSALLFLRVLCVLT